MYLHDIVNQEKEKSEIYQMFDCFGKKRKKFIFIPGHICVPLLVLKDLL